VIEAVMFDLDGVLLDSEQLWDRARRDVVRDHGGRWVAQATSAMQGMSSVEWARYMQDVLGVPLSQDMVVDLVLERLMAYYASGLPLLPGALEAVSRLGKRWPLGLVLMGQTHCVPEQVPPRGQVTHVPPQQVCGSVQLQVMLSPQPFLNCPHWPG
jgi:beta-phosphoglucomutase-like phosphatase (HAD superfamily)